MMSTFVEDVNPSGILMSLAPCQLNKTMTSSYLSEMHDVIGINLCL